MCEEEVPCGFAFSTTTLMTDGKTGLSGFGNNVMTVVDMHMSIQSASEEESRDLELMPTDEQPMDEKHEAPDFPTAEEVENVLSSLFNSIYPYFERNEERLHAISLAYQSFINDEKTIKNFHNSQQLLADIALHPNSSLINKIVIECEFDVRWQIVQQLKKAFTIIFQNSFDEKPQNNAERKKEEEMNGRNINEFQKNIEEKTIMERLLAVNCKTLTDIITPSIINEWNAEHCETPSAMIDLTKLKTQLKLMFNENTADIMFCTHQQFYDWILVPSGFTGTIHYSNLILRRFHDFFGCSEFENDSEIKQRLLNTCWMRSEIKHFSVDENFETSIACCNVTLIVTLYWIPHTQRNVEECESSWLPDLQFPNAKSVVNGDIDDITKQQILQNSSFDKILTEKFFHLQDSSSLLKKNGIGEEKNESEVGLKLENSAEKFFRSGINSKYVYFKETQYEIEIREPFEVRAFPFDAQDVPIDILPKNFQFLAPALIDQKSQRPGQDSQPIPIISAGAQITNLGIWNIRHIVSEFEFANGSCNILLKMERNWQPYVMKYNFIFGFVTALSFTVFSIEDTAAKIEILLGLILTLIFVDLPPIPIATMIDKYFYLCFAFLVALTVESAVSDNEYMIDSKWNIFAIFATLFILIQLAFIAGALFTVYLEKMKGEMTREDIIDLNQRGLEEIQVMWDERSIDLCSKTNAVFIAKALPIGYDPDEKREHLMKEFRQSAFVPMGLNIVALQFPIGVIQIIASTEFGCTFRYSPLKATNTGINTDAVVFLSLSCVSFAILLFVYIAVGITQRHMNIFQAIFVLVLSVNFVLAIDFFSYWSNAHGLSDTTLVDCQMSTSDEISLHLVQWWLLLISIISSTISLAWPALIIVLSLILVNKKRIALGVSTGILRLFIRYAAATAQWTSIRLLEITENHGHNNVLPVTVLETCLGLLVPHLLMTINWWVGRVIALRYGLDFLKYHKFLAVTDACVSVMQVCIAIHSLVFWVALEDNASHNISEGRRNVLIALFVLFLLSNIPTSLMAAYVLTLKNPHDANFFRSLMH